MIGDIAKFLIPFIFRCIQQLFSLAQIRNQSATSQLDCGAYSPRRVTIFPTDDDDSVFKDGTVASPRLQRRTVSPYFGSYDMSRHAGLDSSFSSMSHDSFNESSFSDSTEEEFSDCRTPKRGRKTRSRVTKKRLRTSEKKKVDVEESPILETESDIEELKEVKDFNESRETGCGTMCILLTILAILGIIISIFVVMRMSMSPSCNYIGQPPIHRAIINESNEKVMAWSSYHYLMETIHFEMRSKSPSKFIINDCLEQRYIMCQSLGLNCKNECTNK